MTLDQLLKKLREMKENGVDMNTEVVVDCEEFAVYYDIPYIEWSIEDVFFNDLRELGIDNKVVIYLLTNEG